MTTETDLALVDGDAGAASQAPAPESNPDPDPRIAAFLSPLLPDLFHAFAYSSDVWKADPCDVESIHTGARQWFDRTVARVLEPSGMASGRILLLLGESGSGKTHLMRAFRNRVHSRRRGYCGYMQMTAFTGQYGRYVLNNLVDSLDRPYFEPDSPETGLMRLAHGLAGALAPGDGGLAELERLGQEELSQSEIDRIVADLADRVILDDRFRDVDVYLAQALLYLQANDPRIKARVLKYLRCEDLTPHDRALLGGIVPCTYPDAPHWVIQRLGQVIWAVERVPLILCVDQLEDVFDLEESAAKFRKAIATLCDLVSRLPSAIVVISCLENFYDELRSLLTRSTRDRVESDPRPVSLQTPCDRPGVETLIGLRLKHLFQARGVDLQDGEPTFPLPEALVQRLVGLRARDVLIECQLYRDRCVEEGKMAAYPFPSGGEGARLIDGERIVAEIERAWNDFRAAFRVVVPSDEDELAEILAQAIRNGSLELDGEAAFEPQARGRFVEVERTEPGETPRRLLVGVCNKGAQGGGLGRQIEELLNKAVEETAVAVRSSAFPAAGARTVVGQLLQGLVEGSGRCVTVEDSDWRTMMALAAFQSEHETSSSFPEWRKRTRPLLTLGSLRAILALH